MGLRCVKTICQDCNSTATLTAEVVELLIGKQLTEHTAALLTQVIRCLECNSPRMDIYAPQNKPIINSKNILHCRICNHPVSEPLRSQFGNANFCLLCVAEGKVSDADVVRAKGTLGPGEIFRSIAFCLRDDAKVRLRWLRKAVQEGDNVACSRLGDMLSHSTDTDDLAEAAEAYEQAVNADESDAYAHRRLAEIVLRGRGVEADREAAIRHFYAAGEHGNSVAFSRLARYIFNGQFGLTKNSSLAFALFSRAYEMNSGSVTDSAAVALMLLQGIGIKPDEKRGTEKLRHAILKYGVHKPKFDADACFEEVLEARNLSERKQPIPTYARAYLDKLSQFGVPGAARLLRNCGGSLPPGEVH